MKSAALIGLVAGEASGDLLGADLLPHLRRHFPQARFVGIGGERMIAEGFQSLFPLERLSVMGFVEPLKRLPELLNIRYKLCQYFLANSADLVLGIDSPDFNLGLELSLRNRGVLTAHYVSPSVWAWRQGRVEKIRRAVDLMLTLFPFERDFYQRHQIPATFVGHPLADSMPLEPDPVGARRELGLADGPVLALMPGSRGGEIDKMCELFLQAAARLWQQNPALHFIIPAANRARHGEISARLKGYPQLPITLLDGDSQRAMTAADAVLLTSGTTALEAMLLKKPMVVAYRLGGLTHLALSKMVKTPYISLPNLLANEMLVPELIQRQATVDQLVAKTQAALYDLELRSVLAARFREIHQRLRHHASATAAEALANLVVERGARG